MTTELQIDLPHQYGIFVAKVQTTFLRNVLSCEERGETDVGKIVRFISYMNWWSSFFNDGNFAQIFLFVFF